MEKCWDVSGFDAGSPCGGSCGTGVLSASRSRRSLRAPAAMLSAFLAGACLSGGWLMNWGYSYLWERRTAYFAHVTVLIGKVWFAPCTDTRYTKRLFPRLLRFSLISPLQHSSPQEIQQPTLEFLSEVEREERLTRPFSLITFMKWNTKHKLVSQALWHWKSHALSGKITILQENTTELSVLMPGDAVISVFIGNVCQLIYFLFA